MKNIRLSLLFILALFFLQGRDRNPFCYENKKTYSCCAMGTVDGKKCVLISCSNGTCTVRAGQQLQGKNIIEVLDRCIIIQDEAGNREEIML